MEIEWCTFACIICALIAFVIGLVFGEARTYNRWWGKK